MDKEEEAKKLRDLIIATLNFNIECYNQSENKIEGFNFVEQQEELKKKTEELYQKRSLTKLKYWLTCFTEGIRESGILIFTSYIKQKTGYDYDIFSSFNKRIENIMAKGKITTDNQWREVESLVSDLSQQEPVDEKKIEILNNLLIDYNKRIEKRRSKKLKE